MATLINYLANLNSGESQQGIWVNPEDVDQFRIGQVQFENGGLLDGWVFIGSLESLSFGFQSEYDAFCCWVSRGCLDRMPRSIQRIRYNGRSVLVDPQALYEAWESDRLDPEFKEFIDSPGIPPTLVVADERRGDDEVTS